MATDRPSLITKIKSLMAMASSSFQEEARTSAHLAMQLMTKHGVTLAELAGQSPVVVVDGLTAEDVEELVQAGVRDEMRARGRLGGLARAAKLPLKRRTQIARKAAIVRHRRARAKAKGK